VNQLSYFCDHFMPIDLALAFGDPLLI